MNLTKVKIISGYDKKEFDRDVQRGIQKAKAYYFTKPFLTPTYLAMSLKMPLSFIIKHWKEITQ